MLDAISVFDPENPKTYSIFEFKALSEPDIDRLRYFLLCPACQQKAYFRRASKDGKQACFGSRYHDLDCVEFNPSARKTEEQRQIAEVEQIVLEEDSFVIDFNEKESLRHEDKKATPNASNKSREGKEKKQTSVAKNVQLEKSKNRVCKHGLAKLLTSLLRGSSLAASDLWVYTSEKHKWRAKNLFVNIADAQPTENGAPRMYWGTISHADKTLNWLNPAEDRSIGLPISKYREQLLERFAISSADDVEGAGFILFGKCVLSRDKKRKYIYLWGNDPQYIYLSRAAEA